MLIQLRSTVEDYFIRLGVQTQAELVEQTAHWKARKWAPSRAKSYTVRSLVHTDYHGRAVEGPTGYATVEVEYFTTKSEGKTLMGPAGDYPTKAIQPS